MYVYDIEDEDRLSDEWAISSTNITIIRLEQTYPFLEMTCPILHYFITLLQYFLLLIQYSLVCSKVSITTGTYKCLTSK